MTGRRRDSKNGRPRSRRSVLRTGALSALGAGLGLAVWRQGRPNAIGGDPRSPNAIPPFLTPIESFYRFRNGPDPGALSADAAALQVTNGDRIATLAWSDLVPLATRTVVHTLQCDGNGYIDGGMGPRSFPMGCNMASPDEESEPAPPENWSWRYGGIGNAEWRVVSVRSLLREAGVEERGDWLRVEGRDRYQRHFPAECLEDPNFAIAVSMNGVDLPHVHGAPARLLVPGQYGAMNVKWVERLALGPRSEAHPFDDGPEAIYPVKPIAFATLPADGAVLPADREVELGGAAFAGMRPVKSVLLWLEPGKPWEAELLDPGRANVWSRWRSRVRLPKGTHKITICCLDDQGRYSRPQEPYGDAEGYGGYHELRVKIT